MQFDFLNAGEIWREGKKLYFGFVGVDRRWAVCTLDVDEWRLSAVMSVCTLYHSIMPAHSADLVVYFSHFISGSHYVIPYLFCLVHLCPADAAVADRIWRGWNELKQLALVPSHKNLSPIMRGKQYRGGKQSCMLNSTVEVGQWRTRKIWHSSKLRWSR